LEGEEVSFMVFTDGESVKPMLSAQDYKRVFDNDEGPNTGGMGAYSPTPIVTEELKDKIMNKIIYPTIRGLKREGIIYKGVLYAGLMISDGEPYVLEFNCRFGDPETQVVLPLLKSDLVDIMRATVEGRLRNVDINWHSGAALCVIMASKGYPKKYETGKVIHGLEDVKKLKDVYVFHAGTKIENGNIVTSGGRVLGITALGDDIKDAKDKAYSAVSMISWDGLHYRKDIGYQVLGGEYGAK
ncbi:MAG: phosphoribosylamine--glycine ligase, partial [Nitrospirae bacterium]